MCHNFKRDKTVVFHMYNTGKSTLSLVSFAKYEWFEEWKDDKVTNRGPDYKELKDALIQTALNVVCQIYPNIKDRVSAPEPQPHLCQLFLSNQQQSRVLSS